MCNLAHQNRTIAASDFRVDWAKSPEIPQKEGVSGSEIAARNRRSLATFHRTLKSQCNIALSCLGNRAISGPWPSNPCFFGKSRGFPKKARVFLFAEPLKSLEKRGKTLKKARKIGKRKKQGNRKKQGLEGQGGPRWASQSQKSLRNRCDFGALSFRQLEGEHLYTGGRGPEEPCDEAVQLDIAERAWRCYHHQQARAEEALQRTWMSLI